MIVGVVGKATSLSLVLGWMLLEVDEMTGRIPKEDWGTFDLIVCLGGESRPRRGRGATGGGGAREHRGQRADLQIGGDRGEIEAGLAHL